MPVVCAQRSQEEAGQQGTRSYSTGILGKFKAYVVASTDGSETRAPKVWVSRNVNFNDDAFPYQRDPAVTQGESEDNDASQSDVDDLKSVLDEQCEATSTKTHAIQGESEDNINPDEGTPNVTDSSAAVQQTTTRCSGRTRRAPQHFGDYMTGRELENLALHCDALISSCLPSNTADALADPNWKAAMDREFNSLEENGVWELFKPPSGQGIISGKWHFAHKLDDEGNVVKYRRDSWHGGSLRRQALIFTTPTNQLRSCLDSELSWHVG